VDNPGFKALPRPINYAMPLAPKDGVKAIIVYGKNAAWTLRAAQAVQKAVLDSSGLKLELADDRTVTSDETWLLTDAFRRTPLIVLGNAQDNRLLHALGTRFLLQSNRSWPGGDRFIVRTVFEPFVADVNFVVLEASNDSGLAGATARFAELLKTLPKDATLTLPLFHETGGKDAWAPDPWPWTPPAEYGDPAGRTVSQIALAFKGTPNESENYVPARRAIGYVRGGACGQSPANVPVLCPMSPNQMRVAAAMMLDVCRAVGGRTHTPSNHYGATENILGIRGIFQSGVLDEKELNEFESCMVLSAAYPNEYWYDHIDSDSGYINEVGDRHAAACLLATVNLQDYVLNHCRMDDRTRKEIERRAEGARKTTAHYIRSFRDNFDTWELGETTMLYFYSLLYEGMPQWISNGNLARAADMYVMTADNIPDRWGTPGCYAGLDSYIGTYAGFAKISWHGRGIVTAAAYYYGDPGFRWYSRQDREVVGGYHSSVGGPFNGMTWDLGETKEPSRYSGVRTLPFDERMYDLAVNPRKESRWTTRRPGVPATPGTTDPWPRLGLLDRAAFRDGMGPNEAYMFLAGSQSVNGPDTINPLQNNSIARFTDLGEIWLFTNCKDITGWSRSMVSISNGKPHKPFAACTLEACANMGEVSALSSTDHGVGGSDWTRTIVHWRGHYFVVLDRIEAQADPASATTASAVASEYNMVCRWRGMQPAAMNGRAWVADAPSGSSMRVQATDDLPQTSEHWEADGSAAPFVLSQFKQARIAKGQAQTFQNLLYVAGPSRVDEFEARRVGDDAMMVKGRTAAGGHLALIGTRGPLPLAGFQTDAAVYNISGNTLRLAGLKTLKATFKDGVREIFQAQAPVNFVLDCDTGKGQVEVPDPAAAGSAAASESPVQVAVGAGAAGVAMKPGTSAVTLAEATALPKPAGLLEDLWNASKALPPERTAAPAGGQDVFGALTCPDRLQLPLRRLTKVQMTANTPPGQPVSELLDGQYTNIHACNIPSWSNTDKLEITLTLPQSTPLACIRLVGIMQDGLDPREKHFGKPWHEEGDFTFSLVLSDDGFQKDIRKIAKPKVVFENTPLFGALYYSISRLPTWRIEVGQKARQVKLLPRPNKKDKPELCLTQIETYAQDTVPDLSVTAIAADVDGDGSNELVVGTSNRELAVYRADGKRMWTKSTYPDNIFNMTCDDLDENGKAKLLVYTTGEKLHRYGGDGAERMPCIDIYEAQIKNPEILITRTGGIVGIGAWRPDPKKGKETVLFSQNQFLAQDDGTVRSTRMFGELRGAGEIRGVFPDDPEAMAAVNGNLVVWSAKRDPKGEYNRLGNMPMTGAGGAVCARSFGWVRAVNAGAFKGILAANEGGVNWFPVAAFKPESKEKGWGFDTGGVPVVAAMAEDSDGEGAPEVFLARKDGFVNVYKLADGSSVGLLNTGEPVLGMAMLLAKDGKPRLAVGTKFGVHLFGTDLKEIGGHELPVPAAGFAGPGGKDRDRVYVIDVAGNVTILVLK
jgi:hypothetical protein